MIRFAVLAVAFPLVYAQTAHATPHRVTGVRHWEVGDVTRVAVEVSGDFETRSDRLHQPERLYFDILNARPWIHGRRAYTEEIGSRFLTRIRIAETKPGVTRVVLYLTDGTQSSTSRLINPDRLIVELKAGPPPSEEAAPPAPPVISAAPVSPPPLVAEGVPVVSEELPARTAQVKTAAQVTPTEAASISEPALAVKSELPQLSDNAPAVSVAPPAPRPILENPGKPARHTSEGENSLVRALGLKINRVVIDPGHGGHDQGTMGPKGLLEKDLVLDVALRLGKLIQQRMGAEVIYTRSDDTFIPLEGRTQLANDKKADLFLSIHANSSPTRMVTGIETYYLNFTTSKDALDVAGRENASSQKSVFELQDLIQKITLHDKAEESREFASRIQTSLESLSSHHFPGEKNRGVRQAPFVVLIGATMPSVLTEIGFLSNPREEALLRKPEYRQRIAEALYRGVSRYANSLSHFQVAKN